jgi:hypothetical protein
MGRRRTCICECCEGCRARLRFAEICAPHVEYGEPTRHLALWRKDGTVRAWALVDPDDYEVLKRYKWWVHGDVRNQYAATWVYDPDKRLLLLHRAIMQPDPHLEVDHVNGDGLDNRRTNLRIVTHAQNSQNQRVERGNTSGVRGVRWNSRTGKWIVRLELAFDDKAQAERVNHELRAKYMPYSKEARWPTIMS